MSIVDILLGLRDFTAPQTLKNEIISQESVKYPSEVDKMLLFKTRIQSTWLLCTKNYLYCVLDDKREEKPIIRWRMSRDEVLRNGRLIQLRIKDDDEKPHQFGRVDFGPRHKGWLYSKSIYPTQKDLESKFNNFIKSNFLQE